MAYVNPLPAMMGEAEEYLINYFKKNNALSPRNAINIDFEKLKSALNFPEFIDNKFSNFPYIIKMNNSKYYLDESLLKSQTKFVIKIILIIFGIIGVASIIPYVFYLFSLF